MTAVHSLGDDERPLWRAEAFAFLLLTAVVAIPRLATIGFASLNVDESAYLLIGSALRDGALPYVDIVDRKPLGLYLIYAFAEMVFPDPTVGARVLGGLCTLASAWMLVRMARRFLGVALAPATLGGMIFASYALVSGGDAAQYNVFIAPLVIGAVWLVVETVRALTRAEAPSIARLGVAGLLFGLALQIKYSPAFEAIGLGLLLIALAARQWHAFDARERLRACLALAAMVSGGLLPTAIAAGVYAAIGELDAFLFYNFTVNLDRPPTDYPPGLLALRLVEFALLALPLLSFTALFFARAAAQLPRATVMVLVIWAAMALAGALVQRQPYLHYAYAVVPPLALFATAGLHALEIGPRGRQVRVFGTCAVLLALLGYAVGWTYEIRQHGSPQLPRVIAADLRAGGIQSLYVFNSFGIIYYLSGLPLPTRYTLPNHLLRDLEAKSFRFDAPAEVARILSTHPEVLIVTRPFAPNVAFDRVKLLDAALADSYCTWRIYPAGRDQVTLYRRSAAGGDPARPCGQAEA